MNHIDIVGVNELNLFGLASSCDQSIVKSVKILRIGKRHKSYHEQSGSNIDSWFRVKFKVQGSCKLSKPVKIGNSEKKIKGRLPFRNIPLEATITTDDYGDWYADEFAFFNYNRDKPSSKSSIKYIENLYYLQNKDKIDAKNRETQAKIQKEKRLEIKREAERQEDQKWQAVRDNRKSGLKTRVAALKKEITTAEDLKLYRQLITICNNDKWTYCSGSVPHCYTMSNGKRSCPASELSLMLFEEIYVPLMRAQKKYRGKIEKKLSNYYRKRGSSSDRKRFRPVFNRLLNQHPDIKKAYEAKSRDYKPYFYNYLSYQKTDEARRLVLLEFGKKLTGKNSSPVSAPTHPAVRKSSGSSSLRHSHAGRFHSHKLPPQGKAHRHGNGAVGR